VATRRLYHLELAHNEVGSNWQMAIVPYRREAGIGDHNVTNQLVKFESACKAVSEAKTFYDVMEIRDRGEAMRALGKIAKDRTIEQDGLELRLRSESRLGEMMEEAPKAEGTKAQLKGKEVSGRLRVNPPEAKIPSLKSQGIDKNLANRARTLARMPKEEFERHIKERREAVGKNVDKHIIKNVTSKETKDEIRKEHKQRYDARVKHFLEKTKNYIEEINDTISCNDKFSPEAKAFGIRQLEKLEEKIKHLKELLT
jgi:hypothetical protein